MKRLLSMASAAALVLSMAACQSTDKAAVTASQETTIDSMKMLLSRQHIIDSMQRVAALAKEDADLTAAASAKEIPAVAAPIVAAPTSKAVTRKRKTTRSPRNKQPDYNNDRTYANGNGTYNPPAPVYSAPAPVESAPVPAPKRGWSAKAKGAVIGAGAGAIGGAIINHKNRGAGAVIGGVGGAILGTGVGAVIDRKNGR